MMYYTHIVGGLALGLATYTVAPGGGPISFLSGCMIGALLPDLDHPNAFLNKRLGFSSVFVLCGHRKLTHSLLFAFGVLGILLLGGIWKSLSIGLFVGILSHLLLDMLNPSGVPLLYPYSKKYSIAKIPTNSAGEAVVLLVCLLIVYACFKI